MEIIKINPRQIDPGAIEVVWEVLLRGGVIVYPTDTVYGIGAVISSEVAIERIKRIKGRTNAKPISIMVRDIDMAEDYAVVKPGIERYLPGPYTVLLSKTDKVGRWISSSNLVGVRIPDYPFTRALMQQMIEPITTTSANLSGHPPVHSIESLTQQLEDKINEIDLIVDAGELPYNPPSILVSMAE
ncbi:threonylcarbamoyl-AMP synthase [candidate division Kazan bacterium RBG_13_50_9]|uniref:L-threonylcarbamoyladenylate synthase n=1 Tax=candidate division Kazan bacterium RBG_13_50_9 TaxID=1798535 RepID=A0A1F4NSU3_UNCK3|nr:MAG: threonylcarbamoyl-AMP synthase [candidate division Kazan bacterium RBG_13_50_9]